MEIVKFSITPKTAVANGVDQISASAVIMNGNDYVANEPVVFSITSGSAIFSNGSSSIEVLSNSLGAVSASLVDTVAEKIVIEIALQNDASVHNSLAAMFTQSDNIVDTLNLLLTIDGANADGEDQNQVELQTLSGAIPVSGTSVSLTLTNGAVFISGDKEAKIKTGSNGRASLPFTSMTAGQSKLTAYLDDNIAVYNSVTAVFKGGGNTLPAPTVAEANNNTMTINPGNIAAGITVVIPVSASLVAGDLLRASVMTANDGTITTPGHTVTATETGKELSLTVEETLVHETEGGEVLVWYTVERGSGDKSVSLVAIYTIKSGSDSKNIYIAPYQSFENMVVYVDFFKEINETGGESIKDPEAKEFLKSDLFVMDGKGEDHRITIGGSIHIDDWGVSELHGTVENMGTNEIDTYLMIYAITTDGTSIGTYEHLKLIAK